MAMLELKKSNEHSHCLEGLAVGEFQLPGQAKGLKCGECSTVLPDVFRTIKSPGFLTRERICPKCGCINTTGERVLNVRSRKSKFTDPCE